MNKKTIKKMWPIMLCFLFNTAAVAVMAFKKGYVMNWSDAPEEATIIIRAYNYFSLTAWGYANFAPCIAAVVAAASLLPLSVIIFRGKLSGKIYGGTLICTIIAALSSVVAIFTSYNFTAAGIITSFLLIPSAAVQLVLFIQELPNNKTLN